MTFVIGKMKLVSFSLFLDAFPPRPKMPYVAINIYNICTGFLIMSTRETLELLYLHADKNDIESLEINTTGQGFSLYHE